MDGPQAYGRTAADDAGFEAAFLAHELGRPVRVAWFARRGNGLGYEGSRRTRSRCAAASMRRQSRRARLRRARGRSQSSRLQRARHGSDRAAHGQRKRSPRAVARSYPTDSYAIPNRASTAASFRCRCVGNAASHGQPARPRRSAGDVCVESFIDELARRPRPIRSTSVCKLLQAAPTMIAASSARARSRA
jgi:hypothetical protein